MNDLIPTKSYAQQFSIYEAKLKLRHAKQLPERHKKEADIRNLFAQLSRGIFHQLAALNGDRTIPIHELVYLHFKTNKRNKGYPKVVQDAMRLGWNPVNKISIKEFMLSTGSDHNLEAS